MNAQFKKGVLELCVLSMLKGHDCYGYELTSIVGEKMSIAAGTLYPILKRLKDENLVETYLVDSGGGPARKYYHLTDLGKAEQRKQQLEWTEFTHAVGMLMAKGEEHE